MIFILNKVRTFIAENNLIEKGDTVIVGFSGGADSVFLLHTLYSLKTELGIDVVAAHINHMLRGKEAERDADFANEFAQTLGVPFYLHKTDVAKMAKDLKISAEEAGRKVRYEFFDKLGGKYKNAKIATAHNKNDNAETVLLHLLRGSGITGLSGIPCRRQNIIRPILDITRDEIEEYCKKNKLGFVTDSTNLETVYTRNKIRLKLIPIMKEINPNIINTLCGLSKNLAIDSEFIDTIAENAANEIISNNKIKISDLKKLPQAVARRAVITLAKQNGAQPESVHIDKVFELIKMPKTGKKIDIPGKTAYISYGFLMFGDKYEPEDYSVKIESPCDIKVMGYHITSDETGDFGFDENTVIEIRNRRPGDKIKVNGMTKKIKKIFIDRKIPENERDSYPLLTANGEIVCVLGLVKGDYFKKSKNKNIVLNIRKEVHTNE